jgi:hypothetical protein
MVKVVTFSIIVALVAGTGANAQLLTQSQNWNLGLGSGIDLGGAGGSASTLQGLDVTSLQNLSGGLGTGSTQTFSGAMLQIGSQYGSNETIDQATPLIQSMDGLGTGLLTNGSLLNLTSTGQISSPFSGASSPLGISTASIPWDSQAAGGLPKPW